MSILIERDNIIRLSSTIKTADAAASRALEAAWHKRKMELAGWHPSNGWLIDQKSVPRTASAVR